MSKTYSAGIVTAYGAAKRAGYTGTYEDFCRQQAGYAESAATVEQAKTTAVNAASTATAKAGEAATAATAAQTAKTQTEAAASQALTDISTARSGAISAVQTEGATQTANARAQAQAAATSATTASTKASEASASATSAGQSATNAAASATSAAQSASNAQDVLDSIPADYSNLSEDVDQLKADLEYSDGNLMNDGNTTPGWINSSGWESKTVDETKKQRVTDWIPVIVGNKYTIYLSVAGPFEIGVVFYSQKKDGNSALVQRDIYQTYIPNGNSKYNLVTFTVPETAIYMRIYVNSCGESNYYLYNVSIKIPHGLQILLNKYAIIDNKEEIKTDISKVEVYSNVNTMVALLQLLKNVVYKDNNGAELIAELYSGIGSEHAYSVTTFTNGKYASRYANVGYKTNGRRITTSNIYYLIDLKYTYTMDFNFDTSSKKWINVYFLTDTAVEHIDGEEDYATSDYVETGWIEIVGATFAFTPIDYKISNANPVAVRFSFAFGDEHNDIVTGNEIASIIIERKVRL